MLRTRMAYQVLLSCVALVAALLGSSAPAVAADMGATTAAESDLAARSNCVIYLEVSPGVFEYVNICEDPGDDDSGGGGGGGEDDGPRCDLTQDPYDEFCLGVKSCRADIPSPIDEEKWPEHTRPSPDHIFTFVQCLVPDEEEEWSGWRWIVPYEDALPGLGWDAFGRLETPPFTLSFQPAGMTYVGADTRFALDGLGDGDIIGGIAGPLQATGTLSHVEIDPGDSTGTIRCEPDLRANTCEHVYLATSYEQPTLDLDERPSFPAQARLVYDVTFTMGGVEVNLPGVPDTLESPWNGTLVPVGEIQALVQ